MITNRERSRGDSRIELNDEQAEVDDKGSSDGKLDLRFVPNIVFDLLRFLIFGTEELVDQLVLTTVVLFYLLLVAFWMIDLDLFFAYILPAMPAIAKRIGIICGLR